MLKRLILFTLLVLPGLMFAQTSRWSLRADVFQPYPAFRFGTGGIENAYHQPRDYGFALGVERNWKQNERFRFYQTAMLGYYHQVYFERVFTLESNMGLDFRIWKGLHTGFEVGVGAHQGRSTDPRYIYENNKWVPTREDQDITNRFAGNLNAQLGYRFGARMDVFASAGASVVSPLFDIPEGGVPIFIYTNLRVGVRRRF
jgi:opacity protein-like surface antigen